MWKCSTTTNDTLRLVIPFYNLDSSKAEEKKKVEKEKKINCKNVYSESVEIRNSLTFLLSYSVLNEVFRFR